MLFYAGTIFLSAFLLFQVQPLIAKFVLPWFGGSAAVWSAVLLFFQLLLLAGYLYAHCLIRYLKPKQQLWLHATLLALLGLDHEKLTYRYAGRDFRLTDVHGVVAKGIFA